jgi:hypothetical protein
MAQDRLEALQRSGVRFKGFVIAHEAPRLLAAPAPEKHDFKNSKTGAILPDNGEFLAGMVQAVAFLITLIFHAALLDPALIVILEDGTWLEVMTWYE